MVCLNPHIFRLYRRLEFAGDRVVLQRTGCLLYGEFLRGRLIGGESLLIRQSNNVL